MSPNPNRKVKHSAIKSQSRNNRLAVVGVIVVIAVLIVAFVVLSQNNSTNPNSSPSPSATVSSTLSPNSSTSSSPSPTVTPLTSPAGEYSANGTRVLLETSMGNIIIQLRDDKPITTSNFVNLVNQGIYDGTLFHRIMENFMVQGGNNQTANVPAISDEIGNDNHNFNGTIAMAKSSLPNSANSQFFINVYNNNNLYSAFDATYTVFGRVIDGMGVVMRMSHVATSGSPYDQPLQDITLIKAEILP